jgi:hypothetical protein
VYQQQIPKDADADRTAGYRLLHGEDAVSGDHPFGQHGDHCVLFAARMGAFSYDTDDPQ